MAIAKHPAGADDRDFCRSTHHLAYRDVVVAQFGPWDEHRQDSFFDEKWRAGNIEIFSCDGERCGFAVVVDVVDHLRINELVIHPDWQGRGIGTDFLRSVLAAAATRNFPVRLRVLHKNRAVELYKRLGFIEIGRSETHFELEWMSTGDRRGIAGH